MFAFIDDLFSKVTRSVEVNSKLSQLPYIYLLFNSVSITRNAKIGGKVLEEKYSSLHKVFVNTYYFVILVKIALFLGFFFSKNGEILQ